MAALYDPELAKLVRRAFARLRGRLRHRTPTLAARARVWMRSLSAGAPPETYYTHPDAFPMLLLPWWLETEVLGVAAMDRAFDADVVYSTINGYYFVRMIDDLMDRERPPASDVLPALIVFHTEFQRSYQRHFPYEHPFWDAFASASFASAEMAVVDASQTHIDRDRFLRISARKVSGAKVPIAAVCHRHGRPELFDPWSSFVDLLGCWHQMLNDIRGWNRDLAHGRPTYFLSAASSRPPSTGSVAEWVISDGLAWGFGELDGWMDELLDAAGDLGSPALGAYLERRRDLLAIERARLAPELAALERLAAVLR